MATAQRSPISASGTPTTADQRARGDKRAVDDAGVWAGQCGGVGVVRHGEVGRDPHGEQREAQ